MKDVKTRCFRLADGVHIRVVEETMIDVSESCGVAWLSGSKRPIAVTVLIGDVSHTFQIAVDRDDSTVPVHAKP